MCGATACQLRLQLGPGLLGEHVVALKFEVSHLLSNLDRVCTQEQRGGGASKQGALDKLMLLLAPCGQIPQKTTSLIRVDPASLVVMDGQSNVCDMTGNLRFWRSTAAVVQFYCPNIRHGSDSHPDSSICLSTLLTAAKSSL
jgi:hypothetical protein